MTTFTASNTPRAAGSRRPRLLLALGATVAPEAIDAARIALDAEGLPVTVARDAEGALESGLHEPPDALPIDPTLSAADVVATLRFAGFRGPVLAWGTDAASGECPEQCCSVKRESWPPTCRPRCSNTADNTARDSRGSRPI